MSRTLELLLLFLAVVVVACGINIAFHAGIDFSQLLFGNPPDKSVWILRGGIASIVVGFVWGLNPLRH